MDPYSNHFLGIQEPTSTSSPSSLPSSSNVNSPVAAVNNAELPLDDQIPQPMDGLVYDAPSMNPLKRAFEEVEGPDEVVAVAIPPPGGVPELAGPSSWNLPPSNAPPPPPPPPSSTGSDSAKGVDKKQRGRPVGSKTMQRFNVAPPLVPRARRAPAERASNPHNPLTPNGHFAGGLTPSSRNHSSLTLFSNPQQYHSPNQPNRVASPAGAVASTSTSVVGSNGGSNSPLAAQDVAPPSTLASDVIKLRVAGGGAPMGELHIAGGVGGNGKKGAGGQASRPLPKTVNGPTRRGPAALDSKGKGKASDDEYAGEVLNNDYCESCRGNGRFLCCDGCPRSFHFSCLDPPIDIDNVPEDQWFCVECALRRGKRAVPRASSNIFGPLVTQLSKSNATQYKLPEEIRNFFKGVTTSANGNYVDSDKIRTLKLDRRGFAEDRDYLRLKDAKGAAVLCYRCGGSSAPVEGACETRTIITQHQPAVALSLWRKIISCDYCSLHWHIDCLDPPLSNMPLSTRKWMCPNHVEHVMPKVREPKAGAKIVEITRRRQRNNGNIEIIPSGPLVPERVKTREVTINTKKYRVPEESIKLEFWTKATGIQARAARARSKARQAFRNQIAFGRDDERSRSVASDLTSLNSSSELGLADFLGGSSGGHPFSAAAVAILSRSQARPSALGGSSSQRSEFSTRFEQPTDLMTLTLTRSPLRHLASAQLQASKLRRDSPDLALPPLPDLVKVALAELESIPPTSPVQQRSANPFVNPNPVLAPKEEEDVEMSEPSTSDPIPIPPTTVVVEAPPASGGEPVTETALDALAALAVQGNLPSSSSGTPTARRISDASSSQSSRSPGGGGIPKITLRLNNKPPSVNGSSPVASSSIPATTTAAVPAPAASLQPSLSPILSAPSSSSADPSPALGLQNLPPSSSTAVNLNPVVSDGGLDLKKNPQAPSSVSTPSKLINGHSTYPNHNADPVATSQSSGSITTVASGAGAGATSGEEEPLSNEELKQLRSIRALMKVKGEEKLLAFLQSS